MKSGIDRLDSSWSYLNTPVGVVLYMVDSMTGADDASMCATSQLILKWWIDHKGDWIDHPNDIRDEEQ